MAVINLSPLTLTQDCPNVNIKDDTLYYNEALSYGDFKFHDFVGEIGVNKTNTLYDFKFGTFEFTNITITIETDGVGNIINPEAQYNALVELLDSFSEDFKAVLIKPNDKYRQWYIRIYSTDNSYVGQSIDATVLVSGTTTYYTDFAEYGGNGDAAFYTITSDDDGNVYHPLFDNEADAQQFDTLRGGSGDATAYTFSNDPTGATWYLPNYQLINIGTLSGIPSGSVTGWDYYGPIIYFNLITDLPEPTTLSPFLGVIQASKSISNRNITLILPDGTEADLGAVKQVDEITFSSIEYTEGQIFTLTFCNDTITYAVTDDNDAECVAKGINELIQAENSESYFTKYLTSSVVDNKIVLTAKSAGIPFNVTVSYDGTESYSISNITGNVSNLTNTGFLQGDSVDYKYIERGGEYEFILTVLSECDYNHSSIKKLSWCYDKQKFDCCFINAIEKLKCKCKKGSNVCYIYNVKRSIEYMLDNNYSQEDIQKVVDLGWSLCTSDCGCK